MGKAQDFIAEVEIRGHPTSIRKLRAEIARGDWGPTIETSFDGIRSTWFDDGTRFFLGGFDPVTGYQIISCAPAMTPDDLASMSPEAAESHRRMIASLRQP